MAIWASLPKIAKPRDRGARRNIKKYQNQTNRGLSPDLPRVAIVSVLNESERQANDKHTSHMRGRNIQIDILHQTLELIANSHEEGRTVESL